MPPVRRPSGSPPRAVVRFVPVLALLLPPAPACDSVPVPGQAKRRRRQAAERQRNAARTAPDLGRWEVVVETRDQAELRARLHSLRQARVDEATIRIDTLCGRLMQPTTYRLSRFVANG